MSSSFVGYERYVFDVLKSVGIEDLKLLDNNEEFTTLTMSNRSETFQICVPRAPWKNLVLISNNGTRINVEGEFSSINSMIHHLMEYT